MRIGDLLAAVDGVAPLALAESWDNVGLVVGDAGAPLDAVLVAIDLSPQVMDEALALGAHAVVAYHPPLFRAQRRLVAGDLAYEAVRRGLHVVSPHTALDAARGGTNDVLAEALGLSVERALRPLAGHEAPVGVGRLARCSAVSLSAMAQRAKDALAVAHVLLSGESDRPIERVALCAGSGGELLEDVVALGADLFVTGELGHHHALRLARAGVASLCALHSNTERLALAPLARRLGERLSGVAVHVSAVDRDPFRVA